MSATRVIKLLDKEIAH